MSEPRDLTYSFVNKVAREARQEIAAHPKDHNLYEAVEGGSDNDDRLHYLLNWVEDDRAHREADKLREAAEKLTPKAPDREGLLVAALRIDPYEKRDGALIRKSDGRTMYCEKCP